MRLVFNLIFEDILFIVSYFISIRRKHTAGLHCDMVLRNADMFMKLMSDVLIIVMRFIPRKLLS